MLTKEGDLLIGESNGYIKISCHSIEKSNFVPSILLTDIVVDGEAVPNPYIIDSLAAIPLKAGKRKRVTQKHLLTGAL